MQDVHIFMYRITDFIRFMDINIQRFNRSRIKVHKAGKPEDWVRFWQIYRKKYYPVSFPVLSIQPVNGDLFQARSLLLGFPI